MSVSQEAEQYSTRDEVAIMLGERVKRGERSGVWRMEDGGPVFQHASDVKPDSLRELEGLQWTDPVIL